MRVLFVINQLFKGGAETALINLLSSMPKEKYDIDLMVYDQIDLADTVSLIPKVPSHVRLHNIAKNEKKIAYIKKAYYKIKNKISGRTSYRSGAYRVLKKNRYDVAISFGEWFSPTLVSHYALAKKKYVWIHADADKADFFHPDIPLYENLFDGFIFVSGNSMRSAIKQYPFLENRSYIVNNMINESEVREKAAMPPEIALPEDNLPRLLTVANVRPEKNHLRQLRVMKRLFDKGLKFYWINVGSQANSTLMNKINAEKKKCGLEDYFLFTGAAENPYSVIKRADAVCVLSDHESWSMVITEAKTIGTPVIATKTSGALEQITHGENGILCDFTDGDIADRIEEFLTRKDMAETVRENLCSFSSSKNALVSLEKLLKEEKKLLFVFDDINYVSGARAAALKQAETLKEDYTVNLFSVCAPKEKNAFSEYRVLDIENNKRFKCLSVPTKEVLKSAEFSTGTKLLRLAYAVLARLGMDIPFYHRLLNKELTVLFSSYDAIIVVSEASKLRHFVSKLNSPKKIQWIHTDYCAWRNHSGWTKKITAKDESTYRNFDYAVCLSDTLADKFKALYPSLSDKVTSIPNPIDYEGIIRKSEEPSGYTVKKSVLNLITIGRMEEEKRYDRILAIAKELKERGVKFNWYFVGDGNLYENNKALSFELGLSDEIIFTGYLKNALPLLKECDLFVLSSEYEGTPVTIDEAKVLGVPVLAKNVGGIADQLSGGFGKAVEEITANDIINFGIRQSEITDNEYFSEYNNRIEIKLKSILE